MYYERIIDGWLKRWAEGAVHKPLLLRGARQVGKSTAVRHLGESFGEMVEVNFERNPEYKAVFKGNLDVRRIVSQLSALSGKRINPGETLLFLDEVQECHEAIMSLRFFKEDMPELHVVAAGSLLEFALDELPTFGVARIHSMWMYPMTFDEFLMANGERLLMEARDMADIGNELAEPLHDRLIELLRTFMIVGGMPEVVAKWVESHDFLECQTLQDDILIGYEDDFPKYRKRVDPELLRATLRSAATQLTGKFVFANVGGGYKAKEVRGALDLLYKAGLLIPVTHSNANGLPLGDEADASYRKVLVMDCGLTLRLLNMTLGSVRELTTQILSASVEDLVNKGPMAELLAGLEMQYHRDPNLRHEMFYWQRQAKNSLSEVDYLTVRDLEVLPVEVKASTQGGMKSLWILMREKKLSRAVRCSLENFGTFDYIDNEADGAVRTIEICPLYAMGRVERRSQLRIER